MAVILRAQMPQQIQMGATVDQAVVVGQIWLELLLEL
jgi:hypothetical protein